MTLDFSKKNMEYRAKAREVAEKVVRPMAGELDRTGDYPWDFIRAMMQIGLMGIWLPQEYGGQGAGVLDLCVVIEEISRACGGMGAAYAANALGSFPILIGGTAAQKQRYLPDIAAGMNLIAFGLSEKEAGSDAASLKARATRGYGYEINGHKKWTANADVANLYTIFANSEPDRGSPGISAFVVERNTPGFTIGKREDLLGIRCVPVHELHFRGCALPEDSLLGGREGMGFAQAMITLDRARPGVAAQAVGLSLGALELALAYTRERRQFGQTIASFQAIQFMLADMATQVEAARHLVYVAAQAIDDGWAHQSRLAAMAKVFASDTAMRVTTDAVQLFGGYGYSREYPIEKYMRDAKITQIYEGTNQIQRLVIGRSLVKEGL